MVRSHRLSGPTIIVYHRILIRFHIASINLHKTCNQAKFSMIVSIDEVSALAHQGQQEGVSVGQLAPVSGPVVLVLRKQGGTLYAFWPSPYTGLIYIQTDAGSGTWWPAGIRYRL